MRSALHRQVLAGPKVDDPCNKGILVNHDVIWFQISMQYTELVMKVLQTDQDLFHNHFDLVLFIQLDQTFPTLFLDILGQAHVHSLKN